MRKHYVYAYVKSDGTPYYVGRGTGNRAYAPHVRKSYGGKRRHDLRPECDEQIVILANGLTIHEANEWECDLISILGRKDLGTGCLWNLTKGGDGALDLSPELRRLAAAKSSKTKMGHAVSEETREKLRQRMTGKRHTAQTRAKVAEANAKPRQWSHPVHGQVFCTAKELAERFGFDRSCLTHVAKGRQGTAMGWSCLEPERTFVPKTGEKTRHWVHPEHGAFTGSIRKLRDAFGRDLKPHCLSMVATGARRSYRGWALAS